MNNHQSSHYWVVIPASGIGSRMQANLPKQYLEINQQPVLQIALNQMEKLQATGIVIAIANSDPYFKKIRTSSNVQTCIGGKERVHSVLNALHHIQTQDTSNPWVLVHDAARPCVDIQDVKNLINHCHIHNQGGILAHKAVDTLKAKHADNITTLDRSNIWQAQTPQCFRLELLISAIETSLANNITITDEASAIEAVNEHFSLIEAKRSNIKITQPEDLALAHFFLTQQQDYPL